MSEAAVAAPAFAEPPQIITVTNPATLAKVAEIPVTDEAGVQAAVERARAAQQVWRAMDHAQRAAALRRYRDAIVDNKDRIAEIVVSETGKPIAEVYGGEILYVCDAIGYWTRNAERFLADQYVRPHLLRNKAAYSTYKPLGVVGVIGPWNFPFALTIGEGLPALMAGNAVIIKPSEVTPRSAMIGAEIADEAGLPRGILQAIPGFGATGGWLVDRADMICFTGSVATGKKVAQRAAARLIPVTLELGGKDPMIVLKDADLERAANGCVWAGLFNAGQVCMSVERVYVEEPVYEPFVQKVTERVRRLRQGFGRGDFELGSMTFPPQLEKVERHVQQAVDAGATLLAGGRRNPALPGLFYEPTVLTNVTHEMEVMRDETFGPVIPIVKVRDAEEAIRLANDSPYGLTASIWTRDLEKGRVLARRIEAGAVCVNDALINFMITDVPMGGVKDSGLGRRHGPEGIRKFCAQQTVVVDRWGLKREINWYPARPAVAQLYRRLLNLLFRSGWRKKFLLSLLLALTTTGCPATTWTHPNKQRAEYDLDYEECEEEARLAGPLVSESVLAHCMEDRGYRRAD